MDLGTNILNHPTYRSICQLVYISDTNQDDLESSYNNLGSKTCILKSIDNKTLQLDELSYKYDEIQEFEELEFEGTTYIDNNQTDWNEYPPKKFGKNVIQTVHIVGFDLGLNTNALLDDESPVKQQSINSSPENKLPHGTLIWTDIRPTVSNSDPCKPSTSPTASRSGSLTYTTNVKATSPNGCTVESEVVRTYVLPFDNSPDAPDELVNQEEEHELWMEDLQNNLNESGRQNINFSTTLKVVRVKNQPIDGSVMELDDLPHAGRTKSAQNDNKLLIRDADVRELSTKIHQTGQISRELTPVQVLVDSNDYIPENRLQTTNICRHPQPIKTENYLVCSADAKEEQHLFGNAQPNAKPGWNIRACKINSEAQQYLERLSELVQIICVDLQNILDGIPQQNYDACTSCLQHTDEATHILGELIKKLDYSPYKVDLSNDYDGLMEIVKKCQDNPPLILLHLLQTGYYFYEIGRLFHVNILPSNFALLVHAIQNRLRTLCSGRVSRLIVYVPKIYDSVVSTYYRDRRIERVENFCNCQIKLLSPSHPDAIKCPSGYRALEVKFDPVDGRYLGFADVFRRSLCIGRNVIRIGATIFQRSDGTEFYANGLQLLEFERRPPRYRLIDVKSQLSSRNKLFNTEIWS